MEHEHYEAHTCAKSQTQKEEIGNSAYTTRSQAHGSEVKSDPTEQVGEPEEAPLSALATTKPRSSQDSRDDVFASYLISIMKDLGIWSSPGCRVLLFLQESYSTNTTVASRAS